MNEWLMFLAGFTCGVVATFGVIVSMVESNVKRKRYFHVSKKLP
jgi:hypothetical protein